MFEEIIGHHLPKKILSNAIETGRINHAYIFHGNDGIGKMTLAKKFSQYLICKNKSACMQCSACKQFLANTVDDFKIIDINNDKTEILVEQIREVVNDVYIRPHIFDRKIYIVNNADKMNLKAQNAFLKVFEEPPHYALFILIVSELSGILPTIKSRGDEIRFSPLTSDELKEAVKLKYGQTLPDSVAAISDGSIKTAVSLLNSDETAVLRKQIISTFTEFLKTKSDFEMLKLYKVISENEEYKNMIFRIMLNILTDFVNSGNSELIKIYDNRDINLSKEKIYSIFQILEELLKRAASNANYSLTVLDALAKIKKALRS